MRDRWRPERRQQAAALRSSRERVITAADTERRRVGRNLHDGAQQRLVAVANLLKLAERRLERGDDAVEVIHLAHDELGEAQAELRDLARGLHPVALSERGLRDALESLTVGCKFPVALDIATDEMPDDIRLAAYFIVSESLTNASKYAAATAVRVRVAPVAGVLVIEIVDDGAGGADPGAGTRVTARLPLGDRG
jgi:signal transduction histidine kinase